MTERGGTGAAEAALKKKKRELNIRVTFHSLHDITYISIRAHVVEKKKKFTCRVLLTREKMKIKGMAAITLRVYSRTLTFSLLSEHSILEATFFFPFPSVSTPATHC